MCQKIYEVLPYEFILRMRNWALSNAGVEVVYVTSKAYGLGARDTYGYIRPPMVRLGDADDTGRALSKLPARYQQAVSLYWQYEGRSLDWFASRSGVGVDYRTYQRRVITGHELLRAEITRHSEQVERYRQAARRSTART